MSDSSMTATVESFEASREAVISRQQKEPTDLSTPVVKLSDGILALTPIGTTRWLP